MRVYATMLILLGFAGLTAGAQEKSSGAKQEKKEPAAPQRVTGPDGKKYVIRQTPIGPMKVEDKAQTAPERVTGADGKTYVIKQTPFGPVKVEDKPLDPKAEEPRANMRAYEEGDSIRFESPTPFGVARWVRKKSELNDTEHAVWEREQRKQTKQHTAPKKEGK